MVDSNVWHAGGSRGGAGRRTREERGAQAKSMRRGWRTDKVLQDKPWGGRLYGTLSEDRTNYPFTALLLRRKYVLWRFHIHGCTLINSAVREPLPSSPTARERDATRGRGGVHRQAPWRNRRPSCLGIDGRSSCRQGVDTCTCACHMCKNHCERVVISCWSSKISLSCACKPRERFEMQ